MFENTVSSIKQKYFTETGKQPAALINTMYKLVSS